MLEHVADQVTWKQWFARGTARLRTRKWSIAVEALEQAVAHDDAEPLCHYRLGIGYQKLLRWHDARQALQAAVLRDNNASHGWYSLDWRHRLAFAHRICGDASAAADVYAEGAHLDPMLLRWWQRPAPNRDDHAHSELLVTLWSLVDDDGLLHDEDAALDLVRSASDLPQLMPDKWWFAAYVALYRRGWVQAAYHAKAIAAAVVRWTTEADRSNMQPERAAMAASAYAEISDYSSALQCVQTAAAPSCCSGPQHRQLIETAAALHSLGGEFSAAKNLWQNADSCSTKVEDHERFRELVRGRSVAIVAPAAAVQEQGAEIDSYDLVVRTNFRSHALIAQHARTIGSRTDISYYNGNFEPDNRDDILAELAVAPLRYVVLRFDDPVIEAYRRLVPVRVSHMINPLYRMNAYAVPKIVYDLLRFEPASIKVFNADFFLGPQAHYDGYLDYRVDLIGSFYGHDVLRNFLLMKRWMTLGYVQADERLSHVLQMSEAEVIENVSQKVKAIIAHRDASRASRTGEECESR